MLSRSWRGLPAHTLSLSSEHFFSFMQFPSLSSHLIWNRQCQDVAEVFQGRDCDISTASLLILCEPSSFENKQNPSPKMHKIQLNIYFYFTLFCFGERRFLERINPASLLPIGLHQHFFTLTLFNGPPLPCPWRKQIQCEIKTKLEGGLLKRQS